METYFWDEFLNEGIRELENMRRSQVLATKPELRNYIDKFIYLYRQGLADQIRATAFFPRKIKNKGDIIDASKVVSKNMASLRKCFIDYYAIEGKDAEFEVYFIAPKGDYKLGVRRKGISVSGMKPSEIIDYHEKKYRAVHYIPILFKLNIALFAPLILVLFIAVALFTIAAFNIHSSRYLYPALLSFVAMVAVALIEISLIRLEEKRFVALIWKYFLKLSDQSISVASYSGVCLVCQGVVELKYSLIGWKGYVGKCRDNPDMHTFTFDHTTLSGQKR